jgi:hypothetical protein
LGFTYTTAGNWRRRIFDVDRLVILSYIISVLGFAVDQASTRIGLTISNVVETNQVALHLMNAGLWLYTDLAAVLLTIFIAKLVIERWSFKYRHTVALFPLTFGTLKLVTGMSNFFLYLTLM